MICDILLPDRRTLPDYSASGPCECGGENPIVALKLFWFFASLTVSVDPFVLDSAKVPTNEYDAFLFRLIIPFRENCTLSVVDFASSFAGPFKPHVNKYLSFKLCSERVNVLLDWILFTVKVIGLSASVVPLLNVISLPEGLDSKDCGKSVSYAKLIGWIIVVIIC